MKLLEEIIELASAEKGSVATLLRKCLVLAHALKNEHLKAWAEKELNGYGRNDVIPEYRETPAEAKGLFLGSFGVQSDNQPIPPAALKPEHRHFAETVVLDQPIAAYEGANAESSMLFKWPANLTVLYQRSFYGGRLVLNRAGQEVPGTVLVGLVDTIRTRVLHFALDLRDELGLVSDDPSEVPREKVEQLVVTNIYGGFNVIASRDFTQTYTIEINTGDWAALSEALEKRLGLGYSAISELKTALDQDSNVPEPGLGKRTTEWLKQLGKKSGELVLNVGIEVAKKEATNWILQFLGNHGHL